MITDIIMHISDQFYSQFFFLSPIYLPKFVIRYPCFDTDESKTREKRQSVYGSRYER